jgi:hypothetical protein
LAVEAGHAVVCIERIAADRRGVEMRLVIGAGSGASPRIDSTILKAVASSPLV